jgi:hypothetical protein
MMTLYRDSNRLYKRRSTDLAVAKGVFEKAKELNVGEEIFL